MKIYIAGPMRGHQLYNFPAFDLMAQRLTLLGYAPVNPADLDRASGAPDPSTLPADHDWSTLPFGMAIEDVVKRDTEAIFGCDGYVVLDGWEKSTGARAEKALLDWKGAQRLDPQDFQPWTEDTGNPKDRLGVKKPPLHLIPTSALIYLSRVMALGAKKYGPANWREHPVKMTVYLDAMWRHILQALDGEDNDPESGQPHAAHAMACAAILLDAQACGCLIDDRSPKGAASKLMAELTEK